MLPNCWRIFTRHIAIIVGPVDHRAPHDATGEEASIANQGLMEVVRDSQTLPLINNLRGRPTRPWRCLTTGTRFGGTPISKM